MSVPEQDRGQAVAKGEELVGRRRQLPPVFWQFARFLVVGGISFTVDYGLFLVLHHMLDVQYLVASTISFAVSLVLNYVLTLRYVFDKRDDRNVVKEFALYLGLNVIALGLNQAILFLTVDQVGLSPALGKIVATLVVLVYNFISRRALIERRRALPVSSKDEGADIQEQRA